MKKIGWLLMIILLVTGCKSKKNILEEENRLPKDVALAPVRDYSSKSEVSRKRDEAAMNQLRKEIENLIAETICTNPEDWRISPLGSKPCGGPAFFLAYPIKIEDEILPKITEYNRRSSDYNLKYGIISDCAVTPAPSDVVCESGKAKLVYDN